jgi:4-amino-4-deoxy-L-arabinose transferase-like glycosyltransferase
MKKIVWVSLAIILIFVTAFTIRYVSYKEVGITLDEPFYVKGGLSYVSAALNLSFSSSAWSFNTEHPPISKYIYGIASYILNSGQYDYNAFLISKTMSIICGAITCVIVYLIGRRFFNEYVGILAALILAFTPMMIAHNQLSNIDSPVTMMITATMFVYMTAVKSESVKLYLLSALMLGLSIATKYNTLLIIPVMIGLYLLYRYHQSGGSPGKAIRDITSKPPKLLIVAIGAAIVVLTFYAIWPFLWLDPVNNLEQSLAHWTNSGTLPETLLGASLTGGVPLYYYPLYFLVTTPEIMLLAMVIGLFYLLKSRDAFKETMALWLFLPFVYGLSGFVMGSMRYILMIYPALALVCAYGVYSLSGQIGGYLKKYNNAPAAISSVLGMIVVLSLVFTCLYAQPYYLDYYNSLAGGYQNIQDNKLFLLSWWGESVYDPVQYVESHAKGANVTVMASGIIGSSDYLSEYAKNNTYISGGGMGGFMPSGNRSINRSLNMSSGPSGFPQPGERNMSFGMGGPQQSGGGLLDILGDLIGLRSKNDGFMNMSFGPPGEMSAMMGGPGPFGGADGMPGIPEGFNPQNVSAGGMPSDMGAIMGDMGGPMSNDAANVTADYIIVGADSSRSADYDPEDYTLVYESTYHGVPLYDVLKRTS